MKFSLKRAIIIFFCILSMLAFTACNEAVITAGEVKDGFYTNDSFGLTIPVYDGWTVYSEEDLVNLNDFAQSTLEETAEGKLDFSEIDSAIFFCIEHIDGFTESYSQINITYDKIAGAVRLVKSLKGYADAAVEGAAELVSDSAYETSYGEVCETTIDGETCYYVDVDYINEELIMRQFFMEADGYYLIATVTSTTMDGFQMLDNYVNEFQID